MKKERNTSQKEIILNYLKGVKTHPSAQTVYLAAKARLPRISLGTVYRNLNNLKLKREIQEIPSVEFRYDGDVSPHGHFICEKCDKIYDIVELCKNCGVLQKREIKAGKINRFQINLYGQCKKCSKKR